MTCKMLPFSRYSIISTIFLCNVYGYSITTTESIDSGSKARACHCNLPSCITTNYMCKPENGENGCFKKYDSSTQEFSFGCIDSSTYRKEHCVNSENTSNTNEIFPEYECCYSDMCNKIPEKSSNIHSNIRINESNEEKIKELLLLKNLRKMSSSNYYTNSEIWFRAVLIAVPICGLMVLLILIFVAIRMLKSDKPPDGITSAKLIKKKYGVSPVNDEKNTKTFSQQTNSFFPNLNKRWMFIFKGTSNKPYNVPDAKYTNFYQCSNLVNDNVPRVHEKFSKQNLQILKLPYKFNELKHKNNNCKNVNVNKNCAGTKSLNKSSVVTIDSHVNYNYSLVGNFMH